MSNQSDIVAEIHAIAQTAIQEGKRLWAVPDAQAAAGRLENGLGDIVKKCVEWIEAPASASTPEATPPAAGE